MQNQLPDFDYKALVEAARQYVALRQQLVDVVALKSGTGDWAKAKKDNHSTMVRLVKQYDRAERKARRYEQGHIN